MTRFDPIIGRWISAGALIEAQQPRVAIDQLNAYAADASAAPLELYRQVGDLASISVQAAGVLTLIEHLSGRGVVECDDDGDATPISGRCRLGRETV